ncbi:SDR family oxidoreductase [Mycetocola sp. 2940]|uniref:SDR family NAD(P)-dependent oxidoreductase n=1 Tax=Mycetocola sp. 2940 TaxID=3156452 RepID=UPI003399CD95
MDLQLNGRVALVLGGTGFIGSAIVARLRQEGALVVSASRRPASDLVMDGRDDESVRAGVSQVLDQHGRLDAVIVTAAPAAHTLDPARNSDPEQVREAFDAKALTFLRVANAVLPVMTEAGYGRLIGISGQNAFLTGNVTGSIRNAALIIAAKNLADAAAGSGVTVNTVSPGMVSDHPHGDVAMAKGGESTPEQIADLMAFLASPLAGAISGESIAVGHRVRGVMNF